MAKGRHGPEGSDRLAGLGDRIAAAREAQKPVRSRAGEEYKAGSLAWRMVIDLVAGVLVGGALGWGLDSLFGTLPIFLIILGLFGFAAGIRVMMRTAEEVQQGAADEAPASRNPGGPPAA